MAISLVTTPGASNANSYCSMAEADAYHETHLYATAWTEEGDDEKKKAALIWATRLLDEQVSWHGFASTSEQALSWPRSAVLDRTGRAYIALDVIPTWLKNATAELARQLLIADRTKERSFGLKSVTADTVSVEFDKMDQKPFLPPSVSSMVNIYGDVQGPGKMTVPLVRV